jgi:uncharacterized membrane protein (UPF0182 family)
MPWRGIVVAILVTAIIAVSAWILLALTGDLLVDFAWFSELGYPGIFITVLAAKSLIFAVAFALSAALLSLNVAIALRLAAKRPMARPPDLQWAVVQVRTLPELLELAQPYLPFAGRGAALILATLIAALQAGHWDLFLQFVYQVPYGRADPLFGKDIGFYLFSVPVYVACKNWLLLVVCASAATAAMIYWVRGDIDLEHQRSRISPAVIAHGSGLLGAFLLIKSASYLLDRFLLLYGDNGVVVGASYADVHVELPALWVMAALAALAAMISLANLRARAYRLPAVAAILVLAGSFVLLDVVPALFERIVVKPSELQLERPYIQSSIALTQQAYDLHRIAVKPFPVEQSLTMRSIEANRPTIDNIRLWDWQPTMDTLRQLQEIRTYYKFHDVDVDRYWLEGTYQQVMLSVRELDPDLLPRDAQTWVNRRILFTHGNGVVMSPVTRKSPEGLPLFYLSDIPPVATGGPATKESRIYYGELTDTYVIVRGSTPEFDYPKGKDNVYRSYDGTGGIDLGSWARRGLFAWYFADLNLLLSSYVTPESRILFRRNIKDRVHTIAPFLRLDHDPYAVVSGGRLYWMQDAYTTSRYFPYAQPIASAGLNYIRNAVKIVVDAYNGSVSFYLADPSDPIAATFQKIFPELLKPLRDMPPDLQKHIRYPEELFGIQAYVYRTYHMDSPEVFYNREDLWQYPRVPDGNSAVMAPYYMIMRLPEEPEAEFILMLPMVPTHRENMIAWLAARCDPPNYGKLIVYEFPKEKLVYGPFQIEARIHQNTEISQALSLWNQLGSRVIRGNLLVIPIDNSVLYVTPLYLRAETGQLPELKRVIAAYGDNVVMQPTLAEALDALFKQLPVSGASAGVPAPGETSPQRPAIEGARDALSHYDRAMERLREGDWAGFGAELEQLRAILDRASHNTH